MKYILKLPIFALNLVFGASILVLFILSFIWYNNIELAAASTRQYMDYIMSRPIIKNYIL